MKKISLSEAEVNDLLDLYQSEIDRAQRRINNLKTIIKKLSEGHSIIEPTEEKHTKVKAKRGRKPKVKEAENKAPVEVKEIKAAVKEKAVKAVKKVKAAKNVKPLKEVKAVAEVVTIQEPKKRGRKPKAVAEKVESKKKGRKKKAIKVKATPKRRGRKPKSLRKPIKSGKGENKVKWNDFIVETITSKNSLMLASSITQAALEKFAIPANDRDRVRMAISTTLTKMVNKDKVLNTFTQKGIRGAFFGLNSWFNEKAELNSDYKKKLM